jgi:transcriptional regulator of acetoin/glycerol metabolism
MTLMQSQPVTDLALWERFQTGQVSEQEIAGSLALQRWQRSRNLGLSADNPGEPIMELEGLARAIETFAALLAPGAPFDAFAMEMAKAGFTGLFSDSRGVILSQRIAEPFRTAIARTRLVEGAVWSEAARGTNGIGTALAEGAPVSIVGTEHYEQRNQGLACFAAPVRDIRKRVVAVLDASGPASAATHFVHASVVATAAALEALIVARTYDAAVTGGLYELERLLERMPHATLLVEATGHVRRVNARFHGMMPVAPGLELSQLVRARLAEGPPPGAIVADTPASLRPFSIELEPIGLPEDPFAALVHLRPRHTRARLGRRPDAPRSDAFAAILGSDPVVAEARNRAERFARTDLPVLVLGETGVGKEIFARAIHAASARAGAPFVAVNCGALTGTLLESELFGYGPGAFTGATPTGSTGKLAAAHGGTLFLDEVGEMTAPAQAMLLRFLEDGTYYRVGESTERHADVRLIAATSRDLPALATAGRFRTDLYFRMRGVVLRLPALRERQDRKELSLALLENIARTRALPKPLGISRAALEWIEQNPWPGNVRELRTALEYAMVLAADSPRIELWHLPFEESEEPREPTHRRDAAERAVVIRALEKSRGNLSAAAKSLGVARSTLYRMMARHGLRPDPAESVV